MRVLVTAIDSFIGWWLAESLRRDGAVVSGTTRATADIRDRDAVAAAVAGAAPDLIVHLAARSNVKQSVLDPVATFETNVTGSLHLFEAVRAHAPAARVISVGSSAEYGDSALPTGRLSESDRLLPLSPYGASKAAQGQLARIYARTHGLAVIHVRPFAIIGPRKRGDALSDFCVDIVKMERGAGPLALSVGNTAAIRDFVDVRDCVVAVRCIAERGTPGESYNICHGEGAAISDVIKLLHATSRVRFAVVPDPARGRPVDDPRLIGDPSKLAALGYVRQHTLAETVTATLDYWRSV